MWLAARNHNIYMLHQFILTHGENPDSAYYTGVDPEARYIYVSDNPINLYASGENCRFSMGSIKGGGSSFDLANSIANESFESWKESPGHNKNMLSDSYNMQGTSFIYLGLLYGTTVFGNDRKGVFEINEINLSWDKELEANVKPVFVINNREVFSSTSEEELFARLKSRVDKILQLSKVQYCPKMEFIANKNLEYMEANKQNTSLQSKTGLYYYAKSTKQRWMRAEGKFKLNTLLFYKINEKTIYLSFELKDFFNIEKIFALIDVEVSKSMVPADLIDQYGSAIKFFKKGHFYYCIVDIVYTMKK